MTLPELKQLAAILATPGQRRHAGRWLRSRGAGFLLDTPSPWLTFDAIDRLRALMRDGLRIFEYGSGGSTLFWLRWNVELCSVEHDPEWFEIVKRKLPEGRPVDYRFVPPEPFAAENADADPADPAAHVSSDERFRGRTFRRYAGQIDEFPDGHFDLVLVDGRARPACVHHAAPKIRHGGILVLDNADRPYYLARAGAALRGFEQERYPGVAPHAELMARTDLWVRS